MYEQLTQLGISGLTLGILLFVVRFFVSNIDKKDAYIKELTSNFLIVIQNHIIHETAAQNKTSTALDGLTKAINRWAKTNGKS